MIDFDTINKLGELGKQMSACEACDLCHDRTQVVFGEGSHKPTVMIVGEAPGEQEDQRGIPFVGPAGEKLNKMLAYAEVTRESSYMTNAVLCRPPNNRNPRQEELEACHWRLDLQIKLLKPKLIILLGKIALQQFSGSPIKGNLNEYFFDKKGWLNYQVGDHESKVIVTYHPFYHLHSPDKAYAITLPHWQEIKKFVNKEKQK